MDLIDIGVYHQLSGPKMPDKPLNYEKTEGIQPEGPSAFRLQPSALTYSLIQLYLNKKHLNALANKTITSLRSEDQMGINSVIVYSGDYFAVFDLDDYTRDNSRPQ